MKWQRLIALGCGFLACSFCMLLLYQSCISCGTVFKKRLGSLHHCEGFGQLFGKGRLFGRPFFKTNPQELSTLCIYPENSWTTQRMCQSTKHCQSQLMPTIFILQLLRNIPWTTMTSIVFCLEIMQSKEMHQLSYRTWGGMILKGIFLSNFWNLFMLSNKQLLNCGRYADRCSPAAAVWPILACRARDLTRAEVSQSCGGYWHITHNFTAKAPGGRGSSALSK